LAAARPDSLVRAYLSLALFCPSHHALSLSVCLSVDGAFRTPDFVVSTSSGLVVWMKSFLFEETELEARYLLSVA
jgi:hypothetical protein